MVCPCPCLEGLDLLKLAEALLKAFAGLPALRPLVFGSVFGPLGAAALLRLRVFAGLAPGPRFGACRGQCRRFLGSIPPWATGTADLPSEAPQYAMTCSCNTYRYDMIPGVYPRSMDDIL